MKINIKRLANHWLVKIIVPILTGIIGYFSAIYQPLVADYLWGSESKKDKKKMELALELTHNISELSNRRALLQLLPLFAYKKHQSISNIIPIITSYRTGNYLFRMKGDATEDMSLLKMSLGHVFTQALTKFYADLTRVQEIEQTMFDRLISEMNRPLRPHIRLQPSHLDSSFATLYSTTAMWGIKILEIIGQPLDSEDTQVVLPKFLLDSVLPNVEFMRIDTVYVP